MSMGHTAEWIIPGTFVVLHGSFGDHIRNTMDSHPQSVPTIPTNQIRQMQQQEQRRRRHVVAVDDHEEQEAWEHVPPSTPSLRTLVRTTSAPQTTTTTTTALTFNNGFRNETNQVSTTTSPPVVIETTTTTTSPETTDEEDGTTTSSSNVTSTPAEMSLRHHHHRRRRQRPDNTIGNISTTSPQVTTALEEWMQSCREQEMISRQEWIQSLQQLVEPPWNHHVMMRIAMSTTLISSSTTTTTAVNSSSSPQQLPQSLQLQREWWHVDGKVAVLRELPTQLSNGNILRSVIGTLSPGTTVVASSIIYLDSQTLQPISIAPYSNSNATATGDTTTATATATDDDDDDDNHAAASSIYPRGRLGWICMIQMEHVCGDRTGYACINLDGYPLLAPGIPSLYTDPNVWIWRVTCPAGAYVREGLELNTHHLYTLPYGTLVRVTQRTINSQGLSRLQIHAVVEEEDDDNGNWELYNHHQYHHHNATQQQQQQQQQSLRPLSSSSSSSLRQQSPPSTFHVTGWCSESLNPLSGNWGKILEPLAFPVPALYRVTLAVGAVVRSGVELSSSQLTVAPRSAILKITGRAYSEHPNEQCLERLRLAGDGGWISVRLNRAMPDDDMVVEFAAVDSTFDPDTPGLYHLHCLAEQQQQQQQQNQQQRHYSLENIGHIDNVNDIDHDNDNYDDDDADDDEIRELSSIDTNEVSVDPSTSSPSRRQPLSNSMAQAHDQHQYHHPPPSCWQTDKCLICLSVERNATIVHGETGHIACCLGCARILKARGDSCPVCRLPIDMVIQHFWA